MCPFHLQRKRPFDCFVGRFGFGASPKAPEGVARRGAGAQGAACPAPGKDAAGVTEASGRRGRGRWSAGRRVVAVEVKETFNSLGRGSKPMVPFWGTTHFRTYFSGDWDVHWELRFMFNSLGHG